MKEISLTQDKVALVDDWEYENLNKYKWCVRKCQNTSYATRRSARKNKTIYMHHLILPLASNLEVDHIDKDGLNNQRHNLRLCTRQQNMMNKKPSSSYYSKFKGVTWYKRQCKWVTRITINRRRVCLGYFDSEKEAAFAYNVAATEHFGGFAQLNNIDNPINREELMEKLIWLEKEKPNELF